MALKRLNKRGNEELFMPEIIILLVSIFFFSAMLYFVNKNSTSSLFYEELYAKKIGLIIEGSKSGDVYKIDITKPWEVSRKNKMSADWFKTNFLSIENQAVVVKLASKGGYKFNYFSSKQIESSLINFNEGRAILEIKIK